MTSSALYHFCQLRLFPDEDLHIQAAVVLWYACLFVQWEQSMLYRLQFSRFLQLEIVNMLDHRLVRIYYTADRADRL